MIENLKGIQETVNFKPNTNIRLYNNDDFESYPSHWHTPLEIIMPIENPYYVTCCNYYFALREWDILVICPGAVHSMEASVGKRLIFQADISLLFSIKELKSTLSLISPAVAITPENTPQAHEEIKELLLKIAEEYFGSSDLSEASIYSKLLEIFVLISRNYTSNVTIIDSDLRRHMKQTELVLNICNYINDHFNENITLDDIAKLSGYSKYHISRIFKRYNNVSLYRYLNEKKIEQAEKLLIDKEIPITEIALRCGYSSLSSFIRMFKIIKGCTPTEFRNKNTY